MLDQLHKGISKPQGDKPSFLKGFAPFRVNISQPRACDEGEKHTMESFNKHKTTMDNTIEIEEVSEPLPELRHSHRESELLEKGLTTNTPLQKNLSYK